MTAHVAQEVLLPPPINVEGRDPELGFGVSTVWPRVSPEVDVAPMRDDSLIWQSVGRQQGLISPGGPLKPS